MPAIPPIALVADIHGNSWALDAVLSDITRRGIRQIINLGDSLDGPLDPVGTAARLLALGERLLVSLRGNGERLLLANLASNAPKPQFAQLDSAARLWLQSLPANAQVGEIFCCHGTPDSDETYLLEKVRAGSGVERATGEVLGRLLEGAPGQLVACGHSHQPGIVRLPDGRLVVNPGSVGLPAYTDDLPFPHAMQAGTPHARYAIVTCPTTGWQVEAVAVEYRWDEAAESARRNGRGDWAAWIETGQAAAG